MVPQLIVACYFTGPYNYMAKYYVRAHVVAIHASSHAVQEEQKLNATPNKAPHAVLLHSLYVYVHTAHVTLTCSMRL